jgi:hypothetical protein
VRSGRGKGVLAAALLVLASRAEAAPFVVRAGGAATALAVDLSTVSASGDSRAAWTYQLFWSRRALAGRKVEVLAILQAVNCKTKVERVLATTQYTAGGKVLRRTGPATPWTISLDGSNTDYMLDVICGAPDGVWARRSVPDVFALYRRVWRR